MLATAEQIMTTWEKSPAYRPAIRHALGLPSTGRPTINYVDGMLSTIFERIETNRMGKGVRPWNIVDVGASLDPAQLWIGIEYETGWDSRQEYLSVMNYLWRYHTNNAVDYEGCGEYKAEITFSPVTLDTFNTSNYNMDRLIGWLNERKFAQGERSDWEEVGIHINISAPNMRTSEAKTAYIAEVLSASVDEATDFNCDRFFGRTPYGLFNARTSRGRCWVEGKLFDSTDDMATWQAYKITMNNLARIVEQLDGMENNQLANKRISNLSQLLAGDIEACDLELVDTNYSDSDYDDDCSWDDEHEDYN